MLLAENTHTVSLILVHYDTQTGPTSPTSNLFTSRFMLSETTKFSVQTAAMNVTNRAEICPLVRFNGIMSVSPAP